MKRILYISIIFYITFTSDTANGYKLPEGYNRAKLGISVEELKNIADVTDAVKEGKYYAEHFEWNPEVYISKLQDEKRIEYYFYKNRLYKILIICSGLVNSDSYEQAKIYEDILKETINRYGKQKEIYEEVIFGYLIKHNIWEDKTTKLDIRSGSGYVYKVILNKSMDDLKRNEIKNYLKNNMEGEKSEVVDL